MPYTKKNGTPMTLKNADKISVIGVHQRPLS
jgi:hypothetical protein